VNILLIRFKLGGGRSNIPWHFSFFKDILAKQGHAVEIIDNQVENYTIEEMINHTIEKGFDLVGTGGIGTVYKPLKNFVQY
tara:strand:+ start:803 stop:1045 length:243 start_codon:yes stop_codon:yes gene_type:complete